MPLHEDGSGRLRPFTADEIEAFNLRRRGVRDGSSIVDQFGPDGSSCTRPWFCDWESRYDVMKYFVGDMPVMWDDAGTKKISRVMPQTHPLFANWIATKITDCRGHQYTGEIDDDGVPVFKQAELTVQYEMCDWELLEDDEIVDEFDRYLTFDGTGSTPVQAGSQYLTLPGGCLKYWRSSGTTAPNGKPIPFNVGFVENEEKFSWLWRRLPFEVYSATSNLRNRYLGNPSTSDKPLIGTINSFANAPLNRRAGTTMFTGVQPMLKPDPTGEGFCWDLKLDFTFKPQRHNHIYFFATDGTTTANGYYYVGVDSFHNYGGVPDDTSLASVRDLSEELFNIN